MGEKNQRVTLEDLAAMVQQGFAETATRAELDRLETNVARELALLKSDAERFERDLTALAVGIPDRVVEKLNEHQGVIQRLERIEKQLGITS